MTPGGRALVGAVLAGGASARMGRDKGALVVESGETLGVRAVRVLKTGCDRVVALGHGRGVPEGVARIEDARARPDDPPAGPIGAVVALLRSGLGARYVVLPIDMPGIEAEHVRALVDACVQAGAACACFSCAGVIEPLPFVIDAAAQARVEAQFHAGERKVGAVIASLEPVTVAITDRAVIRNINTPADFDDERKKRVDR